MSGRKVSRCSSPRHKAASTRSFCITRTRWPRAGTARLGQGGGKMPALDAGIAAGSGAGALGLGLGRGAHPALRAALQPGAHQALCCGDQPRLCARPSPNSALQRPGGCKHSRLIPAGAWYPLTRLSHLRHMPEQARTLDYLPRKVRTHPGLARSPSGALRVKARRSGAECPGGVAAGKEAWVSGLRYVGDSRNGNSKWQACARGGRVPARHALARLFATPCSPAEFSENRG